MRPRRSWRKRSLDAVLGLMLGWLAAAYAPGALHRTPDAPVPAPSELRSDQSGEALPVYDEEAAR